MSRWRWVLVPWLATVTACSLAYLTEHAGEPGRGPSDDGGQGAAADARADVMAGRWSVSVDASAGFADLAGVWGSGAQDVWAVGYGQIEHWDGANWTSSDVGAALEGIWGAGPRDVWSVGAGGTVLHYNGSAWLPVDAGTKADLHGVWGSGHANVWAVGEAASRRGTILHFDGNVWSEQKQVETGLTAIAGGAAGPLAVGGDNVILRYAQGSWTKDIVQFGASNIMHTVWTSDTSAWAAGNVALLRYGGETWTPASTSGYRGGLSAMWGSGPNDIWGVSFDGTMAHCDGTTWSLVPRITDAALNGVWGRAPNDVWAVGTRGTILHFQ
ncbi:WD40/YVTN/BNR-like repeat-containing protein [Pendulispora albinea]|uniref:Uncharacterized protein n=1 Tax=Pendulispora albinea TaxID=2741071 RepID=A0ABZ2M0G0_9BACT